MGTKYWEVLLLNWRKNNRDGFTIPYIIGSQNYLPLTHSKQNVEELLMDIAKSNEVEIYITYCMNIKDIILGLRDGQKKKIAGNHLILDGNQSNLFLTSIITEFGNDIDSVIKGLTVRYQPFIDAGEYSMNNKERGNYNSEEVEFIKKNFSIFFV